MSVFILCFSHKHWFTICFVEAPVLILRQERLAFFGEPIVAKRVVVLAGYVGFDGSVGFVLIEGGIEKAFLSVEEAFGAGDDLLGDAVSVIGLASEDVEDVVWYFLVAEHE